MRKGLTGRFFAYLVLAVLAVAVTVLVTFDFGRFKGRIESYASDTLGRDVRIDGPLHLSLGRVIELSAENVRIASTDWSTSRELVSIGQLEARVDAWSLLGETATVSSLAMDGLRVDLERNAAGLGNWASLFGSESPERPIRPSRRFPVVVDNLDIVDSAVTYTTAGRPEPAILAVSEATSRIEDSEGFHVEVAGDLNATPVSISLDAGSVEDMLNLSAAEVTFSMSLGQVYFDGEAEFADLLQPSRPTVRLELAGPSIEYLTDILGIVGVATGPLDLSLTIEPAVEDMRLDLSGDVGEFAVLANGSFDDLRQLERVDVEFSASGPSVRTIAELFGRPEFPEGAFDASGRIRRAGSDAALEEVRLTLGETRAVIDGLFYGLPNPSMSDASLRISGPDFGQFDELLGLPGRLDGPFDIAADLIALETGGARLDMKGMVQAIELSIEGPLADAADLVGSELRLGLSGPDLSVLARAAGRDVGPEDPFTLEMSMRRISEATLIERGQGRVGEDHFSFSARLEDGPPIDWSLTFEAALPDLAARLAGLGIDYAGLPASAAEASGVIRSAERGYEIDNVAISFAGAELLMNGQLGPLADLEATDLAIRVSGPALARLLPPRDAFGGLNRPFTVTANTRINASEIAIEDAALEMDGTTLHGSLAFELDDILGRGRFSVETNSPGVLGLWPPLPELSVDPAEPFALRVAGDWAESVWNLGAFDVDFPDGSLTASGTTTGPPNFEDTNLSVDWAAPNLNVLGALTGRDLPDESTRFHFELTGDRDELTISNLRGVIGASDVRGEIVITRGDVPTIAAELTSELIDLDPYVPPELETAVEADGERINPDGRWIPDVPVDIETLQGISATANIRASDIRAQDRVFNNLVLEGSILNGQLRFDNFDLEADGGTMQGALTLRPGVSALELGLRVSGENLSVGFFSLSPHDPESFPRYELDLALAASGNTVREMAATTNGYLSLVGGPGRLRSSAIRFYTRDFFSELLDALNPFSATDPELDLNCTVVLAAINDGRLAGDPALVMQSDRVTVYADALFDLDSERVDVNLRTVPRRGLGVSLSNLVSPYVKIGGTLASPSIALDPEGALIEGGIAAATGGASMLAEGLWERFLRSGDPCSRAISYADGELQALQERLGPVVSAALE